jgi:hypothetical protein
LTNQSNHGAGNRITDWRATIYHLTVLWGGHNRMPTSWEWNEWTKAVHAAAQDRARSGWTGEDPIYDEGYQAGFDDAMALAEEEARDNPAGPYPYA